MAIISKAKKTISVAGYGLTESLPDIFPEPYISNRAPTSFDRLEIGRLWIDKLLQNAYILVAIVAGGAIWLSFSGATGIFTSLTVNPGPTSLTGTLTQVGTANINATGTGVTTIGTGGSGATNIGNATGNTAVTGSLTASTSLTATAGNITATNGDVVISTATKGVTLPGGPRIISGAGGTPPAATPGSMYLRTDGATNDEVLYVTFDGTTWAPLLT